MHAYIVVDLGFGDSGKGLLTDFLVRHLGATFVVRYNGGAQAGHNVVAPDGRHHTFSQFGSGTFIPGVRTYLSRNVVIHPTALLVEGDILMRLGIQDAFSRLHVSDQAPVITPFHQATNRIREILRGANRHGSCGVGVGEVVEDTLLHTEDCIRAGELSQPDKLRRKLQSIRERKRKQIDALCRDYSVRTQLSKEYQVFEREDLIDAWISSIARISELGLVVSDLVVERWLREAENVIFEGAQGVLLDADAGFHPFTTWSRCTTANASELINEMMPADAQVTRIGVMRCYAMRHGLGPLPTETNALISLVTEHNKYDEWQGAVRYGWFDAILARYALEATGGVDVVALTHLDLLPRLEQWNYCSKYKVDREFDKVFIDSNISNGIVTNLHMPRSLSLTQRGKFTQALSSVAPILENCDTDEQTVFQKIGSFIGYPIGIVSRGPSAGDVEILSSVPLHRLQ